MDGYMRLKKYKDLFDVEYILYKYFDQADKMASFLKKIKCFTILFALFSKQ